ncbi:MAG: Arm DNA-binding domain-containing protein, partial [Rhodoferax sp.]
MTTIHLTPDFLAHGLLCPEGKSRVEFCDTDTSARGLYLEVSASRPGQGIFRLRYRDASGKTCHAKLGRTSEITLDAARKQAASLKAQIAVGTNPKAKEEPKLEELTFEKFFDDHYYPYVTSRKRSHKRD